MTNKAAKPKGLDRQVHQAAELIRATGVTVQWAPGASSLRSYFVESTIVIGTKDAAELILCSLAHEFGHILSKRAGFRRGHLLFVMWHLGATLPPAKKREIIAEERRAWRLGFRFFRDHDIPVTKDMRWARDVLIRSNERTLKKR